MLPQAITAQLGKKILLAFLFALLCTVAVSYYRHQENSRCYFTLKMKVQSEQELVMAQLFYDIGRGFNQDDSLIEPVISDNTVQKVSFRLPIEKIHALRLDPLNEAGIITIEQMGFVGYYGQLLGTVELSDIKPLKDIDSIVPGDKGVVITATSKSNPDMALQVGYPYPFEADGMTGDLVHLMIFALKLFVILFVGFSVPLLATALGQRAASEKAE